jgi:hypothetical protein
MFLLRLCSAHLVVPFCYSSLDLLLWIPSLLSCCVALECSYTVIDSVMSLQCLIQCGQFPHHPFCGDGWSDVEASGEMYVASGACSSCDRWWWCVIWCCGQGCFSCRVESGGGPVTWLIQHVSWLDPIGWHGDGSAAHEDLQCLLSPWQELIWSAVWGFQHPARYILMEEDVCALLEVTVHKCCWVGMVSCWN